VQSQTFVLKTLWKSSFAKPAAMNTTAEVLVTKVGQQQMVNLFAKHMKPKPPPPPPPQFNGNISSPTSQELPALLPRTNISPSLELYVFVSLNSLLLLIIILNFPLPSV